MAIAPLAVLPDPPLPTDAEAVFDAKAGATLTAQQHMVNVDFNANLIPAMNLATAQVTSDKNAASTSAGNAATSESNALTSKNAAQAAAQTATIMAAASQAAVGLPSLAGHAGQSVKVKQDESGLEYGLVGQEIGDILVTWRNPGATYLEANGAAYTRAAYPLLAAAIGDIFDPRNARFGNVGTMPSAGLGVWGPSASGVVAGNTVIVAFNNNSSDSNVYGTYDTVTGIWTSRTFPVACTRWLVTFGAGLFVAMNSLGINADYYTSINGVNWVLRTSTVGIYPTSLKFINSLFVIVGRSTASGNGPTNSFYTSVDGITWTARTFGFSLMWQTITYGGGFYVALTTLGFTTRSSDLVNWTAAVQLPLATLWPDINFVPATAATPSFFMAVNSTTASYVISYNGIDWFLRVFPFVYGFVSIAVGGGLVIVASNLTALVSDNGSDWIPIPGTIAMSFGSICFTTSGTLPAFLATPSNGSYSQVLYVNPNVGASTFIVPNIQRKPGAISYIKAKVA